jgi:replicative DNA helicase
MYLTEINVANPSSAYIEHYSQIVADRHVRRRRIGVAQKVAELACLATDLVGDMLAG